MPARLSLVFIFLTLCAVLTPRPTLAAMGGVTRAQRFDVPVTIDLPITQYYCPNPTVPTLNQIETDTCAGKTLEQNKAECQADANTRSSACSCVYWLQSGANCPVSQATTDAEKQARDAAKQAILERVKEKLGATSYTAVHNTNTNVLNESTFHENTLDKLRPPQNAADPAFVNQTTGETAKAVGSNKIYYAGCFNLDFPELGIPPETGWLTMAVNAPIPEGIVPPSFKKESTITGYLQNFTNQLPGEDPVIKELKNSEPNFSSDADHQKDFPKIDLKLASRPVDGSKNKYLVYWRLCTAKGVSDCEISNYITDIENIATKQTAVATSPNDVWGQNTSDPITGAAQCFTTGDFDTAPLTVISDTPSYFGLRAKIVGQAGDEVHQLPNPHCQNSAEVTANVLLDNTRGDRFFGSSNFAAVAYCPEYDYVAPTGDSSALKKDLAISGSTILSGITRMFADWKNNVFALFEKHIKVDSPPQQRSSCENLTRALCGDNPQNSAHLSISHLVTPSNAPSGSGVVPVTVTLHIINNSEDDATNVDVNSYWNTGANVTNIKDSEGDFPDRQYWKHLDRLPGNNTDNNVTELTYTADIDATTQDIYRLQDIVAATVAKDATDPTATISATVREAAQVTNVGFRVGQASSTCEKIAWMVCYFQGVASQMTSKHYTREIQTHIYPYSDVQYTASLQTAAVSGKDGLFNIFKTPTDPFSKDNAEEKLTTRVSSDNLSKTLVQGPVQDQGWINKLWHDLTPPGQTPPAALTTAADDGTTGPITPPPPPIISPPPSNNLAFNIPTCNNLGIPVKTTYTQNLIDQAAASEGVPSSLLAAVLYVENPGKYNATGPDASCTQSVCGAFGWYQLTCGYQNVVCEQQNPARHCSNYYCCDSDGDGVPDQVCDAYKSWFTCPGQPVEPSPSTAAVCDPAQAAVLAAQKLKGKIGVSSGHQWTADDACRAAARYFGAGGACDTAGGTFARLGNCSYGHFVREFVTKTGL